MTKTNQKYIFPKKSWEFNSSKEYTFFHDKLLPYVVHEMNTTGLIAIRHGEIIFSYGNVEEISYIASCRKSVLAMLYGKYVENGTIDLDMTLEELEIGDIQELMPIEKKATIRDLISSKSGIYHPASNPGDDSANAPERGSQEPGEYFLYNNWDFNAAGGVFEKLTGIKVFDALEKDLAIPLGMQDFKRNEQKMLGDDSRSKYMAYHMWFSTRDMARLGYLLLRNGEWNGKQIISKKWIKEMLSPSTKRSDMKTEYDKKDDYSYGYMWWLFDHPRLSKYYKGAYTARGFFGQYILVIPKLDLVIAHKTKGDYLRQTSNFEEFRNKMIDELDIFDNLDKKELKKTEKKYIDKYLGEYKNIKTGVIIRINKKSNKLFFSVKRKDKYVEQFEFKLCREHVYNAPKSDRSVFEFDVNKNNEVKGLSLLSWRGNHKYKKL